MIMATMMQPCHFYGSMKGCEKGVNCPFSHNDPESVPICRFYRRCKHGNNCRFRHPMHTATSLAKVTTTKDTSKPTYTYKHDLLSMVLIGAYINGAEHILSNNRKIPMDVVVLCQTYCNSVIPSVLKSMVDSLQRQALIKRAIQEYCALFTDYDQIETYKIANKIAHGARDVYDPKLKQKYEVSVCDLFYNEHKDLRRRIKSESTRFLKRKEQLQMLNSLIKDTQQTHIMTQKFWHQPTIQRFKGQNAMQDSMTSARKNYMELQCKNIEIWMEKELAS
eukprot:97694_1